MEPREQPQPSPEHVDGSMHGRWRHDLLNIEFRVAALGFDAVRGIAGRLPDFFYKLLKINVFRLVDLPGPEPS
jgi:hypothetical protein